MVETPEWLTVAFDEARYGVREIDGAQHNPRIVKYHEATALRAEEDEVPWCAAFVNWCLDQAGFEGTNKAIARSFLEWGRAIRPPPYGAIVVMRRGNHAWQGHVGFLLYRDTPETLLVLGGNQSNAVCVSSYSQSKVLGYRWPTM